jgi:hypothetical protein
MALSEWSWEWILIAAFVALMMLASAPLILEVLGRVVQPLGPREFGTDSSAPLESSDDGRDIYSLGTSSARQEDEDGSEGRSAYGKRYSFFKIPRNKKQRRY